MIPRTMGSLLLAVLVTVSSATQADHTSPGRASSASRPLAFVGVSVVPMDREEVRAGQTVIVEGDRIVSIGPADSTEIPVGAVRIDALGQYILPGLIDMHVHVREQELSAYVANGITSVRNMWGYASLPEIMRRVETGEIIGPTIYSASPGLDGPPGYWPETQIIDDPAGADGLVAQQISKGWLFLKVYQNLRLSVYDAILVSARQRGIPVVGHVPTDVPVEHALAMGQISLEHLHGYDLALTRRHTGPFDLETWIDIDSSKLPALAEKTRQAGAWNCPTLAIWEIFTRGMATADRQRVLSNRGAVVDALQNTAGRILVGTDSGIDRTAAGTSIHDELDLLRAAGLSAYQALWGATFGAARFLGKTDEIGSVAVDHRADLLLLQGNPLENVSVVRQPAGILWHGVWRRDPALSRQVVPCASQNPQTGCADRSPRRIRR